jgi:hypothetical protein
MGELLKKHFVGPAAGIDKYERRNRSPIPFLLPLPAPGGRLRRARSSSGWPLFDLPYVNAFQQ